jgi:hypothetical protein
MRDLSIDNAGGDKLSETLQARTQLIVMAEMTRLQVGNQPIISIS